MTHPAHRSWTKEWSDPNHNPAATTEYVEMKLGGATVLAFALHSQLQHVWRGLDPEFQGLFT